MGMVGQLSQIGYFIRAQRTQMRFGELSRAPLRLLRLELRGNSAECDLMCRPADEWDRDIPQRASDLNVSTQALHDAIAVRDLLFFALPGVDTASLRVFRESPSEEHQLIITASVAREQQAPRCVASAALRANLLGLQFRFEHVGLDASPWGAV